MRNHKYSYIKAKIYKLLVYMQGTNSKLVIAVKSANAVSKLHSLIH